MGEPTIREIRPLFFSPLVLLEVPDCDGLNRELLLEAAAMRAASPGLQVSNQGGWHSPSTSSSGPSPAVPPWPG
ncbi:MAG: hypothetical protein LVS60_14250 [Nodosilinea sp. LVE1205-7]